MLVHGANRLGTNSLLDINVFGRRAGIAAAEYSAKAGYVELPEDPASQVVSQVEHLRNSTGTGGSPRCAWSCRSAWTPT